MANFGYQSKSIISGVSTRPYALREDGQMLDTSKNQYVIDSTTSTIDSENCMLSTKFGLCKRPGTTYVQTVESNVTLSEAVFVPLLTEDSERVLVGIGSSSWQVYGKDGNKYPVAHFPSDKDSTATAVTKYLANDPDATFSKTSFSTTTLGDVTFLCDSNVKPRMKGTTWGGYTDTVTVGGSDYTLTNDDVFALWVRNVPITTQTVQNHSLKIEFADKSTPPTINSAAFDCETIKNDTTNTGGENTYARRTVGGVSNIARCRPHKSWVASSFAYQISNIASAYQMEATNLNPNSYGSASASYSLNSDESLDTVMARLIRTDTHDINSVSLTGSTGVTYWGTVAWKNVDSISDLPPNSWEKHTVKVGETSDDGAFYMRFYSDDENISSFVQNSGTRPGVTATTKIPRTGHWEEYCGVGIEQDIDPSTMPLLFVTRPDNSYALMEGRGSFVMNTNLNVTFIDTGNFFKPTAFVAGFTNTSTISPLVVGDSIEFSAGTLPTGLSLDTKYYIRTKTYDSGWKYTLSLTPTGAEVAFSGSTPSDVEFKITTYEDFKWQPRVAGDDKSNPLPPFVDNGIQAIFNYNDRLGFVTKGEVTFSGTGDYFNFFRTTVRDLDPSDPFSASPNLDGGDQLKFATVFQKDLVLISTRAQYTLKAENGLSPETASIHNASRIETDTVAGTPALVGDYIYVASQQEDASTVTALMTADQSNIKLTSFDTSLHTPGYLPQGARKMVGSNNHNMLFFLDDTDNTNLYTYSWYDTNDGRAQSAWNKWTFGTDYTIKDILVHGDRLYLLATTASMVVLEYIDLDLTTQDTLLSSTLKDNFDNCLIDHKTHNTAVTTDGTSSSHGGIYEEVLSSGDTKIKVKWRLTSNNSANVVVVKSDGTIYEVGDGSANTITVVVAQTSDTLNHGTTSTGNMTEITVHDVDLRDEDYYVGLKYTMNAVFGPFIPSTQNTNLAGRNLFAKMGRLTFSQANEFKVFVNQNTTYTQTISASDGTSTRVGDIIFAVRKHLPDMEFVVRNEKPWNTMIQGIKYDFIVQEIAGG